VSNLEHDFQTPQPNKTDVIPLRLKLLANGYRPVPVLGKRPPLNGWQNICKTAAEYEIRRWSRDLHDAVSTGILGGLVIGVDIDVLIPELAERLAFKCKEILGHTPLRRVGRAPKILFCYRVEAPIRKLSTPTLILGDGSEHKVEILAEGQQFVAFGIHPDTRQPYRWGDQTPLNTPFAELPLVTLEALERFKVEAEKFIREAGGLTANERKKKEAGPQQGEVRQYAPPRWNGAVAVDEFGFPTGGDYSRGGDFFRSVNDAAMRDLGRWVPDLLPKAKRQGTGAWRVSSRDLGRDLQEDLSIAPNGIVDFGVADQGDARDGKRSPIDLVIEQGGNHDPASAALWLCDRLGIAPATLGWEEAGNADSDAGAQSSQEQAEKARKPLPWLDMSNWDSEPTPEREWAIFNRVPLRQAGLFSGEGGTGKSIIELMKNVAHVTAKDWLGSVPEMGPAFYIGAEDDKKEIHIRLAAIAKHYDVTFRELTEGGLHVLPLLGKDATLCALLKSGKIETTALYKQLYEAAGDIKPKNISIDTLSRAFAGSEIDRVQVYAFCMHMQALAEVAGGSVTVLSHPSLQGINSGSGISGSTAWHGAFRFRMYLKSAKPDGGEQPDNDLREIEFMKNQYGPRGESIVLRYQRGLFLPEGGVSNLDKAARKVKAEDVFLALLGRFTQAGRNVSDKKSSNNYAVTAFTKEDEAKKHGLRVADLEQAMRDLFKAGKIHVETYGRTSHPHSRLVAGPGAAG
jgi:RecA-family ATPase